MKILSKYYYISAILFGVLFMPGCTHDAGYIAPDIEDGAEAEFSYKIPGMTAALTRAATLTDVQESSIKAVDVLIYEVKGNGDEVLSYHQRGTGLTEENYFSGSFKVKLAKSKSGERYTMDFLFNTTGIVWAAITGGTLKFDGSMTREDVRQALKVAQPHWDFSSDLCLPMWDAIDTPMTINRLTTFTTPLTPMRSVARLNIGVNLDVNDQAQGLDNFELSNVFYTSNAASAGLLIPDRNNIQGDKVIKPSLLDPYAQTTINEWVECEDNKVINGIYLFELDANKKGSDGTYYGIIFEGEYTDHKGPRQCFYRLEFTDPADPTKRLDFLRNHRYRINILAVTGPGYSTFDDAVAGESGNVVYELSVNESGDINHVVYSDKYFLGVSKLNLDYESKPVSGIQDLKVLTNYPAGWNMKYVDEKTGLIPSWISFTNTSGSANTKSAAVFGLSLYEYNDDPRVAVAGFTAGTLSLDVKITQYGRFFISTDYDGSLMRGDGDSWEVYVWGQVPSGGLIIRAYSEKGDNHGDVCYERKIVDGGSYDEGDITRELDIIGNAWLPMAIRYIKFQYSIDGGSNWVTFKEGPQEKGHYRLKESGRLVALYDYKDEHGTIAFPWAVAMGIDPAYDIQSGGEYYYRTFQIPTYDFGVTPLLSTGTNRNTLFYKTTHETGCGDYEEEGYPKGGWRLPAFQEMMEMYDFSEHIGDLAVYGDDYWTSTDNHVSGASHGGSMLIYLRPRDHIWFYGSNRFDHFANARCVYGDPVIEVLEQTYKNWYFNPNKLPQNPTP